MKTKTDSQQLICVDIGSTYTKGALFALKDGKLELLDRQLSPTTVEHLPDGFYSVAKKLVPSQDWKRPDYDHDELPVFFSSSAKGGLKMAVVGLVPDMSLHIGRLAAFSAGAKVYFSYPYKLARKHIREIESADLDILLLCGGTDGGNEFYVQANAEKLAASAFSGTIIYAGNSTVDEEIEEILEDKKLVITENVMPEFGELNIEPVRTAIREIFLEQIVAGRGLKELVNKFDSRPLPTPLAVYNLAKAIGDNVPGWDSFGMLDIGGATTDFYSFCESFDPDSSDSMLKGVAEPKLKRTVEGDLGMRVTAVSSFEIGREELVNSETLSEDEALAMHEYTEKVAADTSYLPDLPEEKAFDFHLGGICARHAVTRHAGTMKQAYTANGRVWVQTGKDLRKINKIIGTGGYLASLGRENKALAVPQYEDKSDAISLVPTDYLYYADTQYILPLVGNLAEKYPKQSAKLAIELLNQIKIKD